jgi:hypothetical protein
MLKYAVDFKRGSNAELGPNDYFEMASSWLNDPRTAPSTLNTANATEWALNTFGDIIGHEIQNIIL